MCGSFAQGEPTEVLEDVFSIDIVGESLPEPSWNIRPTQPIAVVAETVSENDSTVRRLESARWSLIPPWSQEEKLKFSTFNARSEEAASKASWKASVKSHRCLIPASGYYEWLNRDGVKTPYYIHSDNLMAFAGLYSWWRKDESADWLLTATILTMESVPELSHIHDRNPVPLPENMWQEWLDPRVSGDQDFIDVAVSSARTVASQCVFYEVGPVRGNGPQLIEPV